MSEANQTDALAVVVDAVQLEQATATWPAQGLCRGWGREREWWLKERGKIAKTVTGVVSRPGTQAVTMSHKADHLGTRMRKAGSDHVAGLLRLTPASSPILARTFQTLRKLCILSLPRSCTLFLDIYYISTLHIPANVHFVSVPINPHHDKRHLDILTLFIRNNHLQYQVVLPIWDRLLANHGHYLTDLLLHPGRGLDESTQSDVIEASWTG